MATPSVAVWARSCGREPRGCPKTTGRRWPPTFWTKTRLGTSEPPLTQDKFGEKENEQNVDGWRSCRLGRKGCGIFHANQWREPDSRQWNRAGAKRGDGGSDASQCAFTTGADGQAGVRRHLRTVPWHERGREDGQRAATHPQDLRTLASRRHVLSHGRTERGARASLDIRRYARAGRAYEGRCGCPCRLCPGGAEGQRDQLKRHLQPQTIVGGNGHA